MKMKTYFGFQMKDNRGVLVVYVGVYVFLLVLAIWIRCLGGADEATVMNLHTLSNYVARICMLLLAPIPILVLSSEMIERKSHQHLKVYGFRWNLKATLLGVGMSVAAPLIYLAVTNLLFLKGLRYFIDNTPATGVEVFIELVEYGILILVLSGMAFLLGKYIGSALLALVITLFYTVVVEFFPFDLYAIQFSALKVTFVTNQAGPGWWHWALYWFVIGVGIWIVGMINYE